MEINLPFIFILLYISAFVKGWKKSILHLLSLSLEQSLNYRVSVRLYSYRIIGKFPDKWS